MTLSPDLMPINTESQTLISSTDLDWTSKESILTRAYLIGERIAIKNIEVQDPLATNPLILRTGADGCAVLLRYGVVVIFNCTESEELEFLHQINPHVQESFPEKLLEVLPMIIRPNVKERLESGYLSLQECTTERLQIIAEALGKSIVLDYYEREVSSLFDKIKPFTTAIQGKNPRPPKEKELLGYIGGLLLIEQKVFGIVEVGEKPDPIWDFPELDRLYLRLEDEYELRERWLALEKKLTLISRTMETALAILQRDSSHRVEWYIVILIVIEIILAIYSLLN
ncbi:RMD1 family protein [Synechocystis sp. FACHB-383]|uniref:RMD1 family protein n=1 Tax=Synechocystis sp. FACHB-383 TaxID=2692864 RepID=UPI0016864921|nr:RMD1 family protein [Synechocystis sp. FACHB-383]MBD2655465.1 RMD1 family protein [Synechocystis sp. FACHB-383]